MIKLWEGLTLTGIVAFIIAIWRFALFLKDRREKKLKEMPLDGVSYESLFEEYNDLTPLQKKKFTSSYKGVKVEWHVTFHTITRTYRMGRLVRVMSQHGLLNYVIFKVDLKKFPIIKSAKEGDAFIVTGLVDKVEARTVNLKLIDIKKNKSFMF
ncbi:hypothetical protein [Flagellimonas onchidii]|uniref:hypothetical protein n=1 Tax=Flagellimonas onchidii TaxID=2562684 RepID=UPI0010A65B37|nr:hypothetical protein [Allomuricauda onchidii]